MLLAQASTAGDDTIMGFNTADTISGDAGNDTLHGLGGSDTFVFRDGDGHDVIADFQAGAGPVNVLDLSGVSNVSSFADIEALAVQNSDHLLLDFGNGDAVELAGVTLSEIHADDFRFV
jgi:Ca2+-binding RTX toxin-like protein